MKPVLKVAIVASGYLLALLVSWAAVALHAALTSDANAQASGGMSAFGDLILFVAVFGAAALAPTGAALFFLLSKKKCPTLKPSAPPNGGFAKPSGASGIAEGPPSVS
jgi:hypothetical protein